MQFGGGGAQSDASTLRVEVRDELARQLYGNVHHVRLGEDLQIERTRAENGANPNGTFAYLSLAELEQNQPGAYSRLLDPSSQSVVTWHPSVWIADLWEASRRVSVDAGLRADYLTVGATPPLNAVVESVFGYRTDHVPAVIELTPRIGIAWIVHRPKGQVPFVRVRIPGTNTMTNMAGVLGPNDVTVQNVGPVGQVVYGSLGAYWGTVSPSRLDGISANTGLRGAPESLSCVGPAVPAANWQAGPPPATCADSAGMPAFAASVPSVQLLDPRYSPPLMWKASVGTGFRLGQWGVQPQVALALRRHIESFTDLNLPAAPVFRLQQEDGRPVFADPAGIDPTTGLIGPGTARVDPRFASVTRWVSDLNGVAEQVEVHVGTEALFGNIPLDVTYSLNLDQVQRRGTPEDPRAVQTVINDRPVHRLIGRILWVSRLVVYPWRSDPDDVRNSIHAGGRWRRQRRPYIGR